MIFNCKQYAAGTLMPAHADQRSRISIVIAGQLLERVNQNEQFAAAGSLVIKPGHVVHQNKVGPNGARTLSIELPEWLMAERSAAIVGQWRWFHGGPLSQHAIRLWLAAKKPVDQAELAARLIDVVAAASELGQPNRSSPPAWLNQVRMQLQGSAIQPTCLRQLAGGAGVHPVYLARMFRRFFRCSVIDYANALRLSAATQLLSQNKRTLAEIAAECGYADQSHLSRACRRSFGQTPRRCLELFAAT